MCPIQVLVVSYFMALYAHEHYNREVKKAVLQYISVCSVPERMYHILFQTALHGIPQTTLTKSVIPSWA